MEDMAVVMDIVEEDIAAVLDIVEEEIVDKEDIQNIVVGEKILIVEEDIVVDKVDIVAKHMLVGIEVDFEMMIDNLNLKVLHHPLSILFFMLFDYFLQIRF